MKEKVWINISEKYKNILEPWSNFYCYDSEDINLGKVGAYNLFTDSKEYSDLIEFMNESNIEYNIFGRVYRFTKNEIETSEILWFWTDDYAKDSEIPDEEFKICPKCKKITPHITRNKI